MDVKKKKSEILSAPRFLIGNILSSVGLEPRASDESSSSLTA